MWQEDKACKCVQLYQLHIQVPVYMTVLGKSIPLQRLFLSSDHQLHHGVPLNYDKAVYPSTRHVNDQVNFQLTIIINNLKILSNRSSPLKKRIIFSFSPHPKYFSDIQYVNKTKACCRINSKLVISSTLAGSVLGTQPLYGFSHYVKAARFRTNGLYFTPFSTKASTDTVSCMKQE